VEFPGNNQYRGGDALGSGNVGLGKNTVTMSGWINLNSIYTGDVAGLGLFGAENLGAYDLYYDNSAKLNWQIEDENGHNYTVVDSTPLAASSWYFVAGVYDGANAVLYVNGSVVASNAASPFNPSDGIFKLNRVAYANVDRFGNYVADEVRVSATNRSGAWIATEYNNQSSPNTFLSISGQQTNGGGGTATPGPQPSANSVSPNGSSGSSQVFSFVFSDSQNVANIADVAMLFAPSLVYQNACYVVYDAVHGLVQLASNSATSSIEKPVSSTGTLRNSQCSVGATTVTISGNSLTLSVSITFQGAFSGPQNIYLYAVDANDDSTGWVQSGTYTVAAGIGPMANSMIPLSRPGPSQLLTFNISDRRDFGFLTGRVRRNEYHHQLRRAALGNGTAEHKRPTLGHVVA
jgi:hypothetical protein